MQEILLYTTAGCHLCEQAEQMLDYVATHVRLSWRAQDIADDPALFELYGIRIPVLRRLDNDAELGWPFDLEALCRFADIPMSR